MFETVKDWVVIHKPACKGNPWRTNNMMSAQTLETDDERKSFITSFRDGWYKNQGFDVAERSVNNINAGTLYFDNPAIYMNSLADQDDCMLAIAIYLADCFYTAPTIKLREDYLSDKFIVRLNGLANISDFRLISMDSMRKNPKKQIVKQISYTMSLAI